MKINLMLLFLFIFFVETSFAAQKCKQLEIALNDKNVLYYSKLANEALARKVKSKTIRISQVLVEKNWMAISATTDVSEPGVLFFKNNVFVDAWGGRVFPEDKADVVTWAKNTHLPVELTECFYQSILLQ